MEQNTNTTGTAEAQAASPAPTPAPIDWEARYKGVNNVLQQKTTEWQGTQAKFDSTIAALTQESLGWKDQLSTTAKQFGELQTQYQEVTKKVADYESKAATLEKQLARKDVFLDPEFSAFAEMEKKGLLRLDKEGEDFTTYLRELSATLGNKVDQGLERKLQGATPSAQPGNRQDGNLSKDTLWDQMDAAMKKNDFAGYQSLLGEWVKQSTPT